MPPSPARPNPQSTPRAAARPSRRSRRMRGGITALVVTLDEQMRRDVRDRLEAAGITVVCAGSLREAGMHLERLTVELLVADIDEPRLDYGDLHKAVNSSHPFIRRIAIARKLGLTVALNAFRNGAVGVVGTPLDTAELDRLIRHAKASIRAWMLRLDDIAHPVAAASTKPAG